VLKGGQQSLHALRNSIWIARHVDDLNAKFHIKGIKPLQVDYQIMMLLWSYMDPVGTLLGLRLKIWPMNQAKIAHTDWTRDFIFHPLFARVGDATGPKIIVWTGNFRWWYW
jgi:hypothetical protein